jgi:hypothetical protein
MSENQSKKISSRVLSALQEVVRMAYRQGYKKDSSFIKRHISYATSLTKVKYPDAYIKSVAKKLIPNEEAYNKKLEELRGYYKDELFTSLEKLFGLYHEIAQMPAPAPKKIVRPTKEDEDEFLNECFGNMTIA